MRIERDVQVPMRDGSSIAADVFRPDGPDLVPAIACISPYGKDVHWPQRFPLYDLVEHEHGPNMVWETPNPDWWTDRGYAVVRADTRGSGASPGKLDLLSPRDVKDYFDLIEWAGARSWSNGRVAASGISWYAMLAWRVAALAPPSLAAVIAWEGLTDFYREWGRQGGIYTDAFTEFWWGAQIEPQRNGDDAVDLPDELAARPLIDDWYRERSVDLAKVRAPLLSAGNWGALHLHLRGNIEGWAAAASPDKWLVVHTGTHIDPYYSDWGKALQLAFLDRFCREVDDAMADVAPVRLAIRRGREVTWRDEREWPLARTQWTQLYLAPGGLGWAAPPAAADVPYPARFETEPVATDLELTGPIALRLWVVSEGDDLDVFARLHDVDAGGEVVAAIGPQGGPMAMAMGWLRASHRALDPQRTLPHRPFHRHDRVEPLTPGEPALLEIEIWPTSIVLAAGHRLRLELLSGDDDLGPLAHHHPADRVAVAPARILTGATHASHLLVPVIGQP